LTWFGVFPVVTVIFSLFGHWLNLLPALVRTLVLMPRITRLFSSWLYQDRR
jgi:antibiotic biosynthesis monooxygenase (ABM) superfamily enzyme